MISKKFELSDEIVAVDATKMDIAKIQIESAIEMLFEGHHPIAIHTVAQAGFQIVRDIAKLNELPALMNLEKVDTDFWKKANSAWSSFEHALKDSNELFPGINQELNDISIFFAIHLFSALGGKPTPAMHSFSVGVLMKHPPIALEKIAGLTPEIIETAKKLSREEFLRYGSISIQNGRLRAEQKQPETLQ